MADLNDRLDRFVRRFALALQRATRLRAGGPPAGADAADADLLRTSTRHLPGAAWLPGIVAALVFALVSLALRGNPVAPAVAAVAALIALVLLTGASQENGLFRAAESLQGLRPGAAGAAGHGTIALVLVLAGKAVLLAALGAVTEAGVLAALFCGPVLTRYGALLAGYWLGHGDVDRVTVQVAALWCIVPLLLVVLAGGVVFLLLAVLAAALAWMAVLRFYRSRPGRFGEDRAAALQQACELAFYLGAAVGA